MNDRLLALMAVASIDPAAAVAQVHVVVGSTRDARRKDMARTPPAVLAKRERRRRQKRARAAGRAK